MILSVSHLDKSFRHPWNFKLIPVLKDVSFQIEQKSIVGFLGANGAGKTTTIKCLIGLLSYQGGDLKIFGQNHLLKSVKQQVGYLPERPFFYNYLTAYEFLKFYAQLSKMTVDQELEKRIDELLTLVGLRHAKHMYLKQFSKGMLQRVGMAQAIIHRPRLLVLDEPLSGLDPDGRRQLVQIIQNTFDEEQTTIFFSSHLLDDIDRLCHKLVVIKTGRVRFSGDKSDFVGKDKRSYQIQYRDPQGELASEVVANLDFLQSRIDELRSKKKNIVSVELERVSLDKAFKEFQSQEVNS